VIADRISEILSTHEVVLFMKGSKHAPMCGYSNFVVQILRELGVEFYDIDVLESMELRDGIKQYTSWPTIPQLFIKGEFIGGCDVAQQMHRDGSLAAKFKTAGVKVSC
jgi:monothiol glutaredoxin